MILTVDDDRGRLAGLFPLYRTTYGFGAAAGFQFVRPLGSDAGVTELRAPLVARGWEAAAIAAFEQYFAARPAAWDFINGCSLPPELAAVKTRLPGRLASLNSHPPTEAFVLHLPDSWGAFAAPLKRNTKEAIRKAHNALKRDGLEPEFDVVQEPAAILALLPRFFDLHHRRAAVKGVVPHPDVFSRRDHRAFLAGVVAGMDAEGAARMFVLRVRGEIVALRCGFLINGALYLYYSGFDENYGKYSVMTRLVVEAIKWSIDAGVTTISLSTGRDNAKLRWSPDVVRYQNYCHVGPRWRSRAALAAIQMLRPPTCLTTATLSAEPA